MIHQLQEFPVEYPLRSCEANPARKFYLSRSTFAFYCSKRDPLYCSLIETYWTSDDIADVENLTKGENVFKFEKANVRFISMEDEKLTLIMYPCRHPYDVTWSVTCAFTSVTMAQTFYELITQDGHSELVNTHGLRVIVLFLP